MSTIMDLKNWKKKTIHKVIMEDIYLFIHNSLIHLLFCLLASTLSTLPRTWSYSSIYVPICCS